MSNHFNIFSFYAIMINKIYQKGANLKVGFLTLGCKVNSFDTQTILEAFSNEGYEISDFNDICDIYVINSCCVTNESERKSKQMVRRARKKNPDAIVVLTGCLGETSTDSLKNLTEADIICGTQHREKIIDYINDFREKHTRIQKKEEYNKELSLGITKHQDKNRAFIKVQDGCNNFCAYCIIPYARGRIKSAKVDNIIAQVNTLTDAGYKEIVLTGIHLTSFFGDCGEDLIELIEAIDKNTNIQRLRLGSLEPGYITNNFLKRLTKIDSFCPHFHISLQSGDDKILKAMNRKYTAFEYKKVIENLRLHFPNASVTTDIIVGFPGETEENFKTTCNFVKEIKFAHVHVFPYSRKEGTKAANMPAQLTKKEKADRVHKLTKIAEKYEHEFLDSNIGKILSVLIEQQENGYYRGYSENYIDIKIKSEKEILGKIVSVKTSAREDNYLIGELLKHES